MAAPAPPGPPKPPPGKSGSSVFARKLGPAPVYVWLLVAIGGYLAYRFLKGSASSSPPAASLPASGGTASSPTSTDGSGGAIDTGSPSGGGASAADSFSADLSSLLGSQADINSALVSGLIASSGSVEGLGYGALSLAGQAQQAILDSYANRAPTPNSGVSSSGGSSAPKAASSSYTPYPTLSSIHLDPTGQIGSVAGAVGSVAATPPPPNSAQKQPTAPKPVANTSGLGGAAGKKLVH